MKNKIIAGVCCLMLVSATIFATGQAIASESDDFELGYDSAQAITTGSSILFFMIPVLGAINAAMKRMELEETVE